MALKVAYLGGGVGGAKMAYGLAQILDPDQLTIIVNTGDDFWHYNLRVSPDSDIVMYTLAGLVDPVNGWGIADDTDHTLSALRRYGVDTWFRLGDQDLATHLLRSQWWQEGIRQTEITHRLTTRLGIQHRLLPMADEPVATMVNTVEHGELPFQTYFVRMRWQPTIKSLRLDRIEAATLTDEVAQAIDTADLILIGPSNPWLSIMPILSVPGLKDLLTAREIPRIAVTPVIKGQAVKGPVSKLMAELGYKQSATTVVDFYQDIINGFVYDKQDVDLEFSGVRTLMLDTIMRSNQDRINLAQQVLDWAMTWPRDKVKV